MKFLLLALYAIFKSPEYIFIENGFISASQTLTTLMFRKVQHLYGAYGLCLLLSIQFGK